MNTSTNEHGRLRLCPAPSRQNTLGMKTPANPEAGVIKQSNWDTHCQFSIKTLLSTPLSPPVANPACNRIFWWRRVLVPPSTSFVSPACPSPWQFYFDCNCRERVDCLRLVNVTGEFKSVDPVWNTQASQSQMSPNSSQTGQQHPDQ